jgi:hypothetical protein
VGDGRAHPGCPGDRRGSGRRGGQTPRGSARVRRSGRGSATRCDVAGSQFHSTIFDRPKLIKFELSSKKFVYQLCIVTIGEIFLQSPTYV